MAISFVSFAVFPVTSAQLRVPKGALNISSPSDWAVSILYSLHPPYNLFPSLHLSLATLLPNLLPILAARKYAFV
jgi:hypothetical protein